MRFVSIDTETALFAPGDMAPHLVCVSTCVAGHEPELFDHKEGAKVFEALMDEAIASPDDDPLFLVLQNGAYDFAVLAREIGTLAFVQKIFALHAADRVWDTRIAEWLLDNANGVLNLQPWHASKTGYRRPPKGSSWYGLARLTKKYLYVELDKTSGTRTSFGYLRGVAMDEWTPEHVAYAKEDARATVGVAEAQFLRNRGDGRNPLIDMGAQARAYLALHLATVWGLTTDQGTVAEYKVELEAEMERMRAELATIRVGDEALLTQIRGKKKPVKNEGEWKTSTKVLRQLIERAFKAQGLPVPMTDPSTKFPKGQVATDIDTIEECDDESLKPWKKYKQSEKLLSTYIPQLEAGIVHPSYDFTSTGRSSSFSPNIQNLPRKGRVRECYVPREGHYLCSVDYGSQELVTFAQAMHSMGIENNALAEALNQDLDPHLMFACEQTLEIDYEEGKRRRKAGDQVVKDARQKAKGPNFGFPGGMGAEKFIYYMRNQDPPEFYELEEAEEARDAWFKQWKNHPRLYFRKISNIIERDCEPHPTWVKQLVSGRVRGGGGHGPNVGFSDGCNTFFQGLAADMSKAALWEVTRRCYSVPKSALYGSRVVAFLHDEILAEVPIKRAHYAAMEIAEVMLETGKRYCPDVKSKAEPALMKKWLKGAEYKTNDDGILVPWEPEEKRVA